MRGLYWIALACCMAPVLLPTYPPMVDLPQHVAAVATLDRMHQGTYPFSDLFETTWLSPYWLGYLLVWALSHAVGYVWSAKIVVAMSLAAFVLCCVRLRHLVKAPALFDWLFLLVPFGFAYQWGMLNFLVAAPLGVLFIHQFLLFVDGRRHWSVIVGLSLVLFVAHVLVLLFSSAVCALLLCDFRQGFRNVVRKALPLFSPLPTIAVWLILVYSPSSPSGPWDLGWHRIAQFLPDMLSLPATWSNLFLAAGLLALPWLLARPAPTVPRIAPFGFYVLVMMLAPNYYMGNFFTYNRFQIFGLLLYAMCFSHSRPAFPIRLERLRPAIHALLPVVAMAMGCRSIVDSVFYGREARGFHVLMEIMEPGQRALGLIGNRVSITSHTPVFLHYPLWYQAERGGLVDFNFAAWPSLNLVYRRDRVPAADEMLSWNPWNFDWQRHDADQYRYYIVKASPQLVAQIMGPHQEGVSLVANEDDWFLFERRR